MTVTTKLRHAGDTGYTRGEETRARIVLAALKMFGENGFEGASTRDIATAAGVNPPALQYYFNNKEGVYLACAEHIISHVHQVLDDVLEEGTRVLAGEADDDMLIDAFCSIQQRLIMLMLNDNESNGSREFIAREQAGLGPKLGHDILYERMSKPITSVTTAIVGQLLGKPATDDETVFRTTALSGQSVIFQVMHRSPTSQLDWSALTGDRLKLIHRIVREHTVVLLRTMTAERDRA